MDIETKKEAISFHYDVGNDFYGKWLDSRMVYSCALWLEDESDDLDRAQLNKLDWHLNNVNISDGGSLLDIGCGWGALLKRHLENNSSNLGVGLTLSEPQKDLIGNIDNIEVLLQSWTEHDPKKSYDGVVSIGAFEHFANRSLSLDEKHNLYLNFFSRCHSWLKTGGCLSLQTIVYGSMTSDEQNLFFSNDVFPDSELPTVQEITKAYSRYFELTELRMDGKQYAKTCDIWLSRLRADKDNIIDLYGQKLYDHYVKYLKFCVFGFYSGKIDLARFVLSSNK